MTTLSLQSAQPPISTARINSHVPAAEERSLGTSGVSARYHALLNTPFSHPFSGAGYLIGIEKSPRARIGAPHEGPDFERLQKPHRVPDGGLERDLDQQQRTFTAVMDDPKVMFVSHILRYGLSASTAMSTTDLHYSAYSHTAFGPTLDSPRLNESYAHGWKALDGVEAQILTDITDAETAGRPFTHLMLLSMGWNNDQFEALERYNAIYQHSTRWAATQGRAFNPMVIGITWPSVWGGKSPSDLANRVLHLGSYPTKSMDADEIGFGIVNHIVNAMLPTLEAATGLRSVLIGHSMGARVLTRAYYSADTLRGAVARTGAGPIVIGLQAAFSMNRFRKGAQLLPPFRWMTTGEGAPYQDHAAPGGALALTWAKGDTANPVARYATGAAHVGGRVGHNMLNRRPALAERFERMVLTSAADLPRVVEMGQKVQGNRKVLYIDASSIIASHGDIRNPNVGELVWRLIDGLGG
ncbi:hypothetical protein [Tateyamaria sp. ANG-S1]|uniref:hypothetical protein n=1 Tax=Tateyamaria sp. ANG-S1 TaxID=1577905 RepID=UPI001269A79E|nr:hypothetical protein [Tateyamaria sp. ANG-S1]